MKTYGGVGYSSTILGLATRWGWVASYTPWPLTSGERALVASG
jgi:hypothetical protein